MRTRYREIRGIYPIKMLSKHILPTIFTGLALSSAASGNDIHTMRASDDLIQKPQEVRNTPSVNAVQIFV